MFSKSIPRLIMPFMAALAVTRSSVIADPLEDIKREVKFKLETRELDRDPEEFDREYYKLERSMYHAAVCDKILNTYLPSL